MLGLQNPEAFDSAVEFIANDILQREPVLDVLSTPRSQQLFVLSPSTLHNFSWTADQDTLEWVNSISINQDINQLHLVENELFGSSDAGVLYRISENGSSARLADIGTPIVDLIGYQDSYFIESANQDIWLLNNDTIDLWKRIPQLTIN